jgi:hypothetical protein
MNLFATVIIAQTRFVISVRTHLVVIEEMNSVVGHVTMMASVQFHFFAGKEKTATDRWSRGNRGEIVEFLGAYPFRWCD